jgi:hypothetical protein
MVADRSDTELCTYGQATQWYALLTGRRNPIFSSVGSGASGPMAMLLVFGWWLMMKIWDSPESLPDKTPRNRPPSYAIPESLLWKGPRLCGPFPNNAGAPIPHHGSLHRGAHHVAALVSSIGRALLFFISANARVR